MPKFVALATCFSVGENAILYPLEVLKTRAQVNSNKTEKIGLWWMLRCGQTLVRQEGVRALYRGYGWFTFASLPSNVVYITAYNQLKQRMLDRCSPDATLMRTAVVPMAAGAIADVASILLWNPVEVVVQRLQIENKDSSMPNSNNSGINSSHSISNSSPSSTSSSRIAQRPQYEFFTYHTSGSGGGRWTRLSARSAGVKLASRIYQEEGYKGFFRGLQASILTSAPASAFWWPAYECSKLLLSPMLHWNRSGGGGGGGGSGGGGGGSGGISSPPSSEDTSSMKHVVFSLSGLIAGSITMICTNPFDVAKTRLQTQTQTYGATSALQALARILHHEGMNGLMKGLTPRLVYSVPASGLLSFTYELVLKWSRKDE